MISALSRYLANLIFDNLDQEIKGRYLGRGFDIIELQKRLKVLFIYIFIIPILTIAAYLTDSYYEVGISVVCLIAIRIWNRGHHFKPDICLLVTSGVILGIPLLAHLLQGYIQIPWIFALIMNIFFAPYDKRGNKILLKKIVSTIVCFAAYFINDIITISFFILSFDLIKLEKVGERHAA